MKVILDKKSMRVKFILYAILTVVLLILSFFIDRL